MNLPLTGRPARLATALALGVVLALSGCSFSVGKLTVSKSELQKQVLTTLDPQDPKAVTVTCEGDLEGKVDATQECRAATAEGVTGLNVTVTGVDGKNVKFKLDAFIAAKDLEESIRKLAAGQSITIDSLSCPDDLPGRVGATVRCTGTPADTVGTLEVKVIKVTGLQVSYDVNQVS